MLHYCVLCIIASQPVDVSIPEPVGGICGSEVTYRVNFAIPVSVYNSGNAVVDFLFYRIWLEGVFHLKLLIVMRLSLTKMMHKAYIAMWRKGVSHSH